MEVILPSSFISLAGAIFLLSIIITWSFSTLTEPPSPRDHKYPHRHTARQSQSKSDIDARRTRRHISGGPSPLESLPTELILAIFAMTIPSSRVPNLGVFRTLLRVSRRVQRIAYTTFLPLLPIELQRGSDLHSFHALVMSHPYVGDLIRHLHIEPSMPLSIYEEQDICAGIINACGNITCLTCQIRVLHASVVQSPTFVHIQCKRLSLSVDAGFDWETLLGIPCGRTFLSQVTHLYILDYPRVTITTFPGLQFLALDQFKATTLLADSDFYPEHIRPKLFLDFTSLDRRRAEFEVALSLVRAGSIDVQALKSPRGVQWHWRGKRRDLHCANCHWDWILVQGKKGRSSKEVYYVLR